MRETHRETRSLTLFHEAQCWTGEHLQEPAVEGNPELCSMTTSEAHQGQLRHRLQGPLHSRPLACYKGCPTYREQSAISPRSRGSRLAGQRVEDVHKLRALQPSMDTLWHGHRSRPVCSLLEMLWRSFKALMVTLMGMDVYWVGGGRDEASQHLHLW